MLNPIENVWSAAKAKAKTLIREQYHARLVLTPPGDLTLVEQRTRFLEDIATQVMRGIARDQNLIQCACTHITAFYRDIINRADVQVGR
jgi:hypothetical protein